ncbi:HAD hydrolase-like protein [Nocardia sp. NBC_01499]|uniref:HAD family hydrolase n=1 Tax=Nocardia sp. NBC_01499 TaxID=2903597 RepID=UPI0038691C3A
MNLTELLHDRSCVLFDFDGPICAVFSEVTDRSVSKELAALIDSPIPDDLASAKDPFGLLSYAAAYDAATARTVEHRLTELEIAAVRVARPTEATPALMRALIANGRTIGVVSNNSTTAIDTYLNAHGLRELVAGIYGRTPENLTLLKPDPYLLYAATNDLNAHAGACIFIGDSVSDIEAGHTAHIPVIAFANRPEKVARFRAHSPAALVTSMAEIRTALDGS